ncbi:RidA family protein [Ktedonosporobacter rubrisoli]|uniref:RidA family protein n=1 Tax=Ktedonosporobacter rubrisoli TaxID=2509675 RepID=A0A4P6JM69_KTERU|nr:RidA family protein [Ktedonosporobacter rubrisoli]QBD76102.1 RidA family protein [Ktedonosporobacter rubrisoli]
MQSGFKSYDAGMPWEKIYGFTQTIQAGATLYISGQVSVDAQGNFIGEEDIELQVRTTFANLDRILAFYKIGRERIVQTTVYAKNLRRNFDDIARLHSEYFGEHRPTSTCLEVAELALPEQLIEIAAIAVIAQ